MPGGENLTIKNAIREVNMKIDIGETDNVRSQLLIVPVFEGETEIKEIKNKGLSESISRVLKSGVLKGRIFETLFTVTDLTEPKYIIFAGMGKKEGATLHDLRKVAGVVSKTCAPKGIEKYGVMLRGKWPKKLLAPIWVEGLLHGAYRYTEFKSEKEENASHEIKEILLYNVNETEKDTIRSLCSTASNILTSVNAYRNIINAPPNYMTPAKLADVAVAMAQKRKIKYKVFGLREIEELKMGGIIAVSKGSREEPRFVELDYSPDKYRKTVCLVGKGVTFDSGGISIKPWDGMEKMKYDMAGATAVIGAMDVISQMRPAVRVIGLVPIVENLPGGSAYKPGDILKMYNGKTVEVISTDAEGRLILADALAYGLRYKPDAMIDIATLTGACVIALGHEASGVLGNDEKLIRIIKSAGEETGERVWELPLWKEYEELIKSDHADMKNVGGRDAGTIQGAVFLKRFVGDVPWAHIDIAGTAWYDNEKPYASAGATGWGIRLLSAVIEKFT